MNNILTINNETKFNFEFEEQFEKILNIFAKELKYKTILKVDVLITDNKRIKEISKKYRNIDNVTDVLSFPFEFNDFSEQLGFNFLGEIVLSYEKIAEQAEEFNHSLMREFCYLFTHGLVHLSGRDHKKSLEEEKQFNDIVDKIMNEIKIYRI